MKATPWSQGGSHLTLECIFISGNGFMSLLLPGQRLELSTCWSWPKKEAALRPAGDRVWNQLDQTLAVGPLFREVLTQAAYSDAGARFTQALIEGIFFLIFFSF